MPAAMSTLAVSQADDQSERAIRSGIVEDGPVFVLQSPGDHLGA